MIKNIQDQEVAIVPFLQYRYIYYVLSGVVLAIGVYALLFWGLVPSIDFTGGTLVEFQFPQAVDQTVVTDALQHESVAYTSVQSSNDTSILVRGNFDKEQIASVYSQIASESAFIPTITREEIVGPIIGQELLQKMTIAAGLAIIGILLYIAITFKNITYGMAAIIALLHDTFILFGSFSVLGKVYGVQVDALFVTAVLTTMSFSVHDTIVVFDRIREKLKEHPNGSFIHIANQALTETMTRSINNSLTIVFMLLALFLLGGDTMQWFVFALLVGTIAGTYSSPFVATPILFELQKRKKK